MSLVAAGMTTEQIIGASLKELKAATDAAIGAIKISPCNGPVNWADLRCVEARWVVTDEGESYYEVLIEEAGPDAIALQRLVQTDLYLAGWKDVRVVTEW